MGALISLTTGSISRAATRGVSLQDEQWHVYRLALGETAPLYPRVVEHCTHKDTRVLRDGVYEWWGRWFVVEADEARFVTEAEALRALGGCEALLSLGLGDAAISLELGDLTNARYQLLRAREGL